MTYKAIPHKLRELRREWKLSQDEVASRAGVSRQTIFSIETGSSEPSLALARKLAFVFDCALEELFAEILHDIPTIIPIGLHNHNSTRKEVTPMDRSLLPWTPVSDLLDLHREIDRFFEDSQSTTKTVPLAALNVKDEGKVFVVDVSIPGFTDEDIDIEAGTDFVTIKGEKKVDDAKDKQTYLRKEFGYSAFERTVGLPNHIRTDSVEAEIKHGTLHITLPKVAPTPPKVTKVSVKK